MGPCASSDRRPVECRDESTESLPTGLSDMELRLQDFTELDKGTDLDSLPAPAIQGSLDDVECSHLH